MACVLCFGDVALLLRNSHPRVCSLYEYDKQANSGRETKKEQQAVRSGPKIYRSEIHYAATARFLGKKLGDLPPVVQTEQQDADKFSNDRSKHRRQHAKAIAASESDGDAYRQCD